MNLSALLDPLIIYAKPKSKNVPQEIRSAVEYVASGKLGKVCVIKAWMCRVRGSIGKPPDSPVPAGVDYDRWLGPAPQRPFNQNRFHYNWRFFWNEQPARRVRGAQKAPRSLLPGWPELGSLCVRSETGVRFRRL